MASQEVTAGKDAAVYIVWEYFNLSSLIIIVVKTVYNDTGCNEIRGLTT